MLNKTDINKVKVLYKFFIFKLRLSSLNVVLGQLNPVDCVNGIYTNFNSHLEYNECEILYIYLSHCDYVQRILQSPVSEKHNDL